MVSRESQQPQQQQQQQQQPKNIQINVTTKKKHGEKKKALYPTTAEAVVGLECGTGSDITQAINETGMHHGTAWMDHKQWAEIM